jgi:hypothetical protein
MMCVEEMRNPDQVQIRMIFWKNQTQNWILHSIHNIRSDLTWQAIGTNVVQFFKNGIRTD